LSAFKVDRKRSDGLIDVRGRLGQRVREATRVPPKLLAQLALKGWGNPYDARAAGQKCSSLANIRIERLRPPLAKILRDALVGLTAKACLRPTVRQKKKFERRERLQRRYRSPLQERREKLFIERMIVLTVMVSTLPVNSALKRLPFSRVIGMSCTAIP
jgi:hypothetical protein